MEYYSSYEFSKVSIKNYNSKILLAYSFNSRHSIFNSSESMEYYSSYEFSKVDLFTQERKGSLVYMLQTPFRQFAFNLPPKRLVQFHM